MGLKLNATTGGGSVELDVPNEVTSDLALTVPAAAGTIDRLERAGNIVQVVYDDSASTETEIDDLTYQDTNMSASITITNASNKVLVIVDQEVGISRTATSAFGAIRVVRGSTPITEPGEDSTGPFTLGGSINNSTSYSQWHPFQAIVLDTPGTGTHTYKTQARMFDASNSGIIRFQYQSNSGQTSATRMRSRIILLEVAA